MQKLKTGAAYHGNRMLSHAIAAMTVEGLKRIKSMERDRLLSENRKKYMK